VVSSSGVYSPAWDSAAFMGADPTTVVDILGSQGLYFCDEFQLMCGGVHPLVQPILDEYLPVPAGVDPFEFYACLSCYVDQIDLAVWDDVAFSDAIDQRIVQPGLNAVQLLDQNPYLTRMYTTISPGEMTVDPMFWENPDLEEVTNLQTGTRRFLCNGDSVFILPDGREVYLPSGTTDWPTFEDEPAWQQPWEAVVEDTPNMGAPLALTDNNEAIDVALAAYNAAHGWPGGPGASDDGDSDGSGGDDAGTSGADAGADGDGSGSGSGCGCRTTPAPVGMTWALVALGFGLRSRRRR
jgi:MYXO-CTERM domain-containing protein